MNESTINDFIKFYVGTFNDKSKFEVFMSVWEKYSIFKYKGVEYTDINLVQMLMEINKCTILPESIDMSYMIIGDRRANILLSYKMVNQNNSLANVSQFIQLAYSNNKKYWIHSTILNIN